MRSGFLLFSRRLQKFLPTMYLHRHASEMSAGILILDNCCFKYLVDSASREAFKRNAGISGLEPCISTLNLLEIAGAPPKAQRRLLSVARDLADGRAILPLPLTVLKQHGEAVLARRSRFVAEETGFDWYLNDPDALTALRSEAIAQARAIEARFSESHAKARPHIQRFMKQRGIRIWPDARTFLDEHWRMSEMPGFFAGLYWRGLGFSGEPPVEDLLLNDVWNLTLDADGVAVYQRAFAREQPKKVQRVDLWQLTYLAAAAKRIIATADGPFLRAAGTILHGRFMNARAVHISDLTT